MVQQQIIEKELKFYSIDAYKVAKEARMGNRINTIMQTCFFAISGILEKDEAIAKIKEKGGEIILPEPPKEETVEEKKIEE